MCPVASDNITCDHVTGEYICQSGYIGLTCEHPCPSGTFGKNCKEKCVCRNGGDCHHVTGDCHCLPGWMGKICSTPCPQGYYGFNCTQHCKCLNNGICRGNDGVCRCKPGWTGTQCSEICPEGYFGDHCMIPCECPNENFVCHAIEGCVCRHGYTGDSCDRSILYEPSTQQEETGYASVVAGIMVALMLVGVIVALLFYYRRRVANLKTQIVHVQYIADAQSLSPDRNHFDNPVYSYQTGPRKDDDIGLLNNTHHIRNNLVKQNNTNLERQRSGTAGSSTEDDLKDANGINSADFNSLKNRDADATNPNIYHSIEKLDHVYDEIKQKDVKDIELEYDRLDYSRPVSTWKPQYQRMVNRLNLENPKAATEPEDV